ncbi:type IV toxin-antitoxin system AbiEi family antitoxin domain-containing protein [Iamia majanohamensis]|uniref:Type IV toxin-antitoxin system AbiEi family antitoxin domain-containing protein n=1 Tax=Iamia majanohamensis TaxID=467976 RepID=A0AAF0BXG2_9ACTN|nr:type IV toxin-antitoxin system AbiEi family antitoxin domain-containing protein [Iamia majanohamensis]WCO68978.1 type IV toxin-antitoxin system AbiEi family antitoxin domain-containing protein [Iamia majanohamensis]
MDPMTERAIAERARSQLGLITAAQLREAGLPARSAARRVAQGLLVPAGHHTYRLASAPPSRRADVLALCLDLHAVASHRTAAWLHGLAPPGPAVEVTVAKGRSTRRRSSEPGRRVHTSTNLPDDDIVRIGPIPTTSVARTLLGLAALGPHELPRTDLVAAVEDAVRRRLASDRWLWWVLERRRCRGRDGVSRFEDVLAERASLGPTESWLEREVLRILSEAGLPLPAVQRRVRRRGAFVARVDMLYPAERIVIEALGHAHHASRPQLSADAARASRLTLLGFTVHQVTYDQVVHDPRWLVEVVGAALRNARRAADAA